MLNEMKEKGALQCWRTQQCDNCNIPMYLIEKCTSNKVETDMLRNPKSFYFILLKKMLRVSQDELWNTLTLK